MDVHKGDVLRFTSHTVGSPDHRAKVVEVLGPEGDPPYRVQYDDGRETEIFPGTDCVIDVVGSGRSRS